MVPCAIEDDSTNVVIIVIVKGVIIVVSLNDDGGRHRVVHCGSWCGYHLGDVLGGCWDRVLSSSWDGVLGGGSLCVLGYGDGIPDYWSGHGGYWSGNLGYWGGIASYGVLCGRDDMLDGRSGVLDTSSPQGRELVCVQQAGLASDHAGQHEQNLWKRGGARIKGENEWEKEEGERKGTERLKFTPRECDEKILSYTGADFFHTHKHNAQHTKKQQMHTYTQKHL